MGEAAPVIEDVGGDPSRAPGISPSRPTAASPGWPARSRRLMPVDDHRSSGAAEHLPLSHVASSSRVFARRHPARVYGWRRLLRSRRRRAGVYAGFPGFEQIDIRRQRALSLVDPGRPPDRIFELRHEAGIFAKAADGSSTEERLTPADTTALFPGPFRLTAAPWSIPGSERPPIFS